MRRVMSIALLLLACPTAILHAQFERFGLAGRTVYALAIYGGRLYAATDSGVYIRPYGSADTLWKPAGLQNKIVRAVYPHNSGPISYAVTAGIQPRTGDPDSTLIYCSCSSDTAWTPMVEGIDRSEITLVTSIDGFPSPEICGETFAGGQGKLYRRNLTGGWEKAYDIGVGALNVVRVTLVPQAVWIGGETAIFAPFIARSDDKGKSWATSFPPMSGDNACNAIAFDPLDTSVVYAGMEGSVIVSKDGGTSWSDAGLSGTPFYFYALAVDDLHRTLFAGGSTSSGEFGLYSSTLGSGSWAPIPPSIPAAGIRCLLIVPTAIPEQNDLYIGTVGTGILRYSIPLTSVRNEVTPDSVVLLQSYPNPFNPKTLISFTLPALSAYPPSESNTGRREVEGPVASDVRLTVYDLLGREVIRLVDEPKPPGSYTVQFDGSSLAGGCYFCRLEVSAKFRSGQKCTQTRMLVLMK
jgi:hypothetical protein